MPLHLLGKKSWNVYNHDNIERVKRDEAEAAAKEAAEDQRMQEVDAERRIRQLRGLPVEDDEDRPKDEPTQRRERTYSERDRKRRRLHGEDDTDRDIRYAKENQHRHESHYNLRKEERDAPLYDENGHISLFPEDAKKRPQKHGQSNPEVELEKARQERKLEDQYTMRFSNAGGFKQAVDKKPWYHNGTTETEHEDRLNKNIFGDDDPNRKQREQLRIAADDPLAAMQRGVKGVRQAEKDRNEWKQRQRAEMDAMIRDERREARHRNRKQADDDLEGFSLDTTLAEQSKHRSRHREHPKHHRNKHRSKSPREHRHPRREVNKQ